MHTIVNVPEQMKRFLLKGIHTITEELSTEASESDNESSGCKEMTSDDLPDGQSSEHLKDDEPKDAAQERKESVSPAFETDSGKVYCKLQGLISKKIVEKHGLS